MLLYMERLFQLYHRIPLLSVNIRIREAHCDFIDNILNIIVKRAQKKMIKEIV